MSSVACSNGYSHVRMEAKRKRGGGFAGSTRIECCDTNPGVVATRSVVSRDHLGNGEFIGIIGVHRIHIAVRKFQATVLIGQLCRAEPLRLMD